VIPAGKYNDMPNPSHCKVMSESQQKITYMIIISLYISFFSDLPHREGIDKASLLGLTEAGLADIISSKYINYATSRLLDGDTHKGRLFTILRHPVDQTIISYQLIKSI
jgi:hypothetical protein